MVPASTRIRGGGGFTLVELLVVVAVIALLLVLLLPALSRARFTAQSVQSLSQMRQVGMGWAVYSADADGLVVPGQPGRFDDETRNLYDVGNGLHYRPRWFAMLGGRVDLYAYDTPSPDRDDEHSMPVDGEVFLCPVAADWTSTRNFPFGYNFQFLGNARFRGNDETAGPINFPVRQHQIRKGALTVMFASCMGTAAGKPARDRTPNRADGSRDPELRALGGHGYALDPPRLGSGSDFADRRHRAPEHRSAPDPRYVGGRANVVFCDGHAEAMTLTEMGYDVEPDGRVSVDGPDATNQLFSGDGRDVLPPPVGTHGDD